MLIIGGEKLPVVLIGLGMQEYAPSGIASKKWLCEYNFIDVVINFELLSTYSESIKTTMCSKLYFCMSKVSE